MPAWTDENQLKCEKVRFLSEMSEIDSRWVIFNLFEWTFFKSVDEMFVKGVKGEECNILKGMTLSELFKFSCE